MSDIDEYATRAIESPVAEPPEMTTLVRLARRHRRTRIALRTTIACGLVAVIGIGAFAISTTNRNPGVKVVAVPQGGTQPGNGDFTAADLVERLTAAGEHVTSDGTAPGSPLAPTAQLLCVNNTQVRVYEYDSHASRAAVSDTISTDGSHVGNTASPNSTTIVEWIGPPHFFTNGRIVVLVLQDDTPLLQTLTQILGPTISPQASPNSRVTTPCTTSALSP